MLEKSGPHYFSGTLHSFLHARGRTGLTLILESKEVRLLVSAQTITCYRRGTLLFWEDRHGHLFISSLNPRKFQILTLAMVKQQGVFTLLPSSGSSNISWLCDADRMTERRAAERSALEGSIVILKTLTALCLGLCPCMVQTVSPGEQSLPVGAYVDSCSGMLATPLTSFYPGCV